MLTSDSNKCIIFYKLNKGLAMQSGIYKLTFSSGLFYIGRSDDIPRRWSEHQISFQTGTAAERMQLEYARCGMPKFEVVYECHQDHIDLAESAIIQYSNRELMLNAQYPRRIAPEDWETICECQELLEIGTVDHLRMIYQHIQKTLQKSEEAYELKGQLLRKQEELDQLKSCGLYMGDEGLHELLAIKEENEILDEMVSDAYKEVADLKLKLENIERMSLWQRIFNWSW